MICTFLKSIQYNFVVLNVSYTKCKPHLTKIRRKMKRKSTPSKKTKSTKAKPGKSSGKLKSAARKKHTGSRSKKTSFPIIGIGASAGGMEAFQQLLEHLPDDTGMAFVLIQHLAPGPPGPIPGQQTREARRAWRAA